MRHVPFSFVHAASLLVDHQLVGLGHVDDDLRPVIENATATAFERVVSATLEHAASFLILTGNSFDAGDRSLRSIVALKQGFERLAEQGIGVFILPGKHDPPRAWRKLRTLPDNVHVFLEPSDDPIAMQLSGQTVATIEAFDPLSGALGPAGAEFQEHLFSAHRGPFSIGLMMAGDDPAGASLFGRAVRHGSGAGDEDEPRPAQDDLSSSLAAVRRVDYLALGGIGPRKNIALPSGFAHHPGCTQSCDARFTGPAGCTLFRVDENCSVQSTFIPTASVRWEHFDITLNEQTTIESLREMFRIALSGCRAEAGEQVWVVRWTLRGNGPLFGPLDDGFTRSRFLESVAQHDDGADGPRKLHSIALLPDDVPGAAAAERDPLTAEFVAALQEDDWSRPEILDRQAALFAPLDREWAKRMRRVLGALERERVTEHARRLGDRWLAREID